MKNIRKNYLLTIMMLTALQPLDGWAAEAAANAPKIEKSMFPDSIKASEFATLTIAFTNSGSEPAQLTAAFTENLPAGMVVLGSGQTTCGGKLTAVPNTTKIVLSNAKIPVGACNILVGVTATKGGKFEMKTPAGALQTDKGSNLAAASTTLTIELTNPNGGVARLSTPFSDYLPTGMVILGAAKTTCEGKLTAKAGTGRVILQDARIPAYGSCAILLGATVGPENMKQAELSSLGKTSEQTTANITLE